MKITDNIKTIVIAYYLICIGSILGSSNVAMAMMSIGAALIPILIFKIVDTIKKIKENNYKFETKDLVYIAIIPFLIASIVYVGNDKKVLISKQQLDYYKSLPKKIEKLDNEYLKYSLSSQDDISKFMDLRVKYEDIDMKYTEFKTENPPELLDKVEEAKEQVNSYYAQAIELENEVKEAKQAKEKEEKSSQSVVSSSGSSSGGSGSNNYGGSSGNNSSSNKHIGYSVYIANGNRYYHAISNCKYLEGASTSNVTLTSSMEKFECNCWTNPIPYKPPTSSGSGSSGSSSSSGKTVYIASGNSYYHKSSSCKFLNGASASAVDLNNVGGKHACNCIKY